MSSCNTGKRSARTHSDARKVICAFCFLKKEVRELSQNQEQWIKKIDPNFSLDDDKFPSGLCGSCRLALSAHYNVRIYYNNNYNNLW